MVLVVQGIFVFVSVFSHLIWNYGACCRHWFGSRLLRM